MIRIYQLVILIWQFHFGYFWEHHLTCENKTCEMRFFKSLPEKNSRMTEQPVYESIEILDIVESKIPQMPTNMLEMFPSLRTLKVAGCGLETILPSTFGQTTEIEQLKYSPLKTLQLTDNNLKTLENYSFDKCLKLQLINVANNSITSIGRHAFAELENLDTVDLSKNQLQTLDEKVFANTHKLNVINLARNQLTDAACINDLRNMSELDLSYNKNLKLTTSSTENFGKSLTSLKLSGISIRSTDDFIKFVSQFKDLESLSIANNELNELIFENISGLVKLTYLNLFDNKLTKLPVDEMTHKFPKLKAIKIGRNPWDCLYLGLMLAKLRNSDINYQDPDPNNPSQVDEIKCATIVNDAVFPLYVAVIVIGTSIGLIVVLLLLVYLTLRRLSNSNAIPQNDYWSDYDNNATLDAYVHVDEVELQ